MFTSGDGPPALLVHGASADHTTFRVVGPLLGRRLAVHAIDRRGRGASGDTHPYAVEREFEDVAAVAERSPWTPANRLTVIGHSFGGRVALGGALRSAAIRAVVCYEGAPTGTRRRVPAGRAEERVRERLAAGDPDGALATFLDARSSACPRPTRPLPRGPGLATAGGGRHTIVRELDAEVSPAASLEALGAVRQPVLQILGGASVPAFRLATEALDARLADGRIVVIDGAKHAAHHTHPAEFVAADSRRSSTGPDRAHSAPWT